jgi:hypothetical protein
MVKEKDFEAEQSKNLEWCLIYSFCVGISTGKTPQVSIIFKSAIITRGLYIFYPIFHCGLYCRAVYNAERLIFHDSFSAIQVETKDN